MSAKPKRNPELTRARILESARQLLVDGEGAFEMSWVARAAGVSQGLAYHHFGSKEGLLSAIVNDFYDRIEAAVLMVRLDDIQDWEVRERQRVKSYIDFLISDPLAITIITRLAGTPAVAAVETERWQRLVETGARNMADGQARGSIISTSEPRLLAAMTLGAVRSAVTSEFTSSAATDAAQLADTIWHYVRRGLGMEEQS